ncbi:MAG: hypothetical protein AB4290_04810 [Spirulina sp.]
MSLQELKQQILELPRSDRLALVSAIVESLQDAPRPQPERARAIRQMRGLLKTDRAVPTDAEVAAMLEERRAEKYLQ